MSRELVLFLSLRMFVVICHGRVINPGNGSIRVVHEVLALGIGEAVVPHRPHLLDSGHGRNHGHLRVLVDNGAVETERSALKQGEVQIHPRGGVDAVGMQVGEEGGIVLDDGCQHVKEGPQAQQQKGNERDRRRTPPGTLPG